MAITDGIHGDTTIGALIIGTDIITGAGMHGAIITILGVGTTGMDTITGAGIQRGLGIIRGIILGEDPIGVLLILGVVVMVTMVRYGEIVMCIMDLEPQQ
jgi:hypothetical protein